MVSGPGNTVASAFLRSTSIWILMPCRGAFRGCQILWHHWCSLYSRCALQVPQQVCDPCASSCSHGGSCPLAAPPPQPANPGGWTPEGNYLPPTHSVRSPDPTLARFPSRSQNQLPQHRSCIPKDQVGFWEATCLWTFPTF